MSELTILVIAIVVLGALGTVFVITASSRRDRARATGFLSRETVDSDRSRLEGDEAVTGRDVERAAVLERRGESMEMVPAAPAPLPVPAAMDDQTYGVTRRQFLNRGIVSLMTLSITSFSATMIAFLWPTLSGGFGSKIKVGKLSDIQATIREKNGFFYYAEGRMYLVEYPESALSKAKKVYLGGVLDGMEQGIVALYQKCPHLGCRVPECESSQWFECPCHGSKYNQVGEKKAGPAPRGMDRFAVSISGGVVGVDTSQIILGPAIGTNTTGQEAEGPFCA